MVKELPKKIKAFSIYAALLVVPISLTGCENTKNITTPTGIETTVTPTDEITPARTTVTVDPTGAVATVTPEPTPIPTPAYKTPSEVAEELKNVKVSLDELMNEDVVYPTYFGEASDNLTNEMIKKTDYFEATGLMDYKTAKFLVTVLNYDYLNSDAVDVDKAKAYLDVFDSTQMHKVYILLRDIMRHNIDNPDDQIVISWGIISDNTNSRAVINCKQQQVINMILNNEDFEGAFPIPEEYNVTVKCNDGSQLQLTGAYDDLSISPKLIDSVLPEAGLTYIVDKMLYYIDNDVWKSLPHYSTLFPAFSDPEHANVRRHGLDANAYYEEDLDFTNN